MGVHNEKNEYYNLLQKELKKSHDLIITSEFNKEYSFKVNKFASTKKRRIFDILMGETYDWKFYLLNKLDPKYSNNQYDEGKWENHLYNFIENEIKDNHEKVYEKYFLENEIFLNQFTLRNYPSIALTDSKKKRNEKLLSLLFDTEEIEVYSGKPIKDKKKDKGKPRSDSLEFEMSQINININESKTEENENKDNINNIKIDGNKENKGKHRKMTSSTLTKSEAILLSKDITEENQNKYYSYQIRKHINLIRDQLERKGHPFNSIIKKFSEIYESYINKCYNKINKDDEKKIEETKLVIIKDIQNFIDMIAVALKLFYMKSINYDYFEYEKDEFINLICFILFKEKSFESSLFKFFELSNKKKQEQLDNKKEKFKDITPREVGISLKFRLDEDTEKFKNSNAADMEKNNYGIVQYFKNLDIESEITRTNSTIIEISELEKVNNFDNRRKMSLFVPDKSSDTNNSYLLNKNDIIIYKLKGKKNDKKKDKKERIERESITSYSEFSEKFNKLEKPLREKYKEDLLDNPSEFDIYTEKENHDPKNPYAKAIDYINTIKDYKYPLDKLTLIAIVSAIITDCVDECWKDQKNKIPDNFLRIDSDELLSIYLYIVCKMKTESIYTQLDYIQYFTGTATKQSMVGYFYTTVEGCIKYLMSIEKKEDLAKNGNKKKV